MPRPRVYVTRHLPGGALDLLAQHAGVTLWEGELPPPREELMARAVGSDGLLCLLTDRIDAELLDAARDLLVVSNMATGFDNVDMAAAGRNTVLVTRTPGVLSETTADFTFALLLAAARRVVEADRYVRAGRWRTWGPEVLLGRDLWGATIGIIGMGGIGSEVAKRARGFDMRILYNSRTRKPALERRHRMEFVSLPQLLRESDFVTLHAPLTPQTHHLIGRAQLQMMKPTAILVNTARGPLVDQEALHYALRDGLIAAAALDVTDPEPVPADDPLLSLPNCVIAPHIASASVATRSRMAMLAAERLLQALRGDVPKHAVNREIARRWRARVRRRQAAGA
ncbi:MAG: D-glycerate dehydrogenase [Dehalococcoidia bacterium]|nr:D-glycerate dehydrogenase [Dehalococcoidia bacterium]